MAVYSFFAVSLVGRQCVEIASSTVVECFVDSSLPIWTALEFFFYMGLLKAAEQMVCPFGDDDEDFDLNFLIDRHVKANAITTFDSIRPDTNSLRVRTTGRALECRLARRPLSAAGGDHDAVGVSSPLFFSHLQNNETLNVRRRERPTQQFPITRLLALGNRIRRVSLRARPSLARLIDFLSFVSLLLRTYGNVQQHDDTQYTTRTRR